jgi:hypothetical protein
MHIHRTYRAKILNHSQVEEMLDLHGWSASKLWNVANYHSREQWDETGEIPDDSDLKRELKTHSKYKGLHSQSSQRVLEELAEAFNCGTANARTTLVRIRPATARKTTTTTTETAFTKNIRVAR